MALKKDLYSHIQRRQDKVVTTTPRLTEDDGGDPALITLRKEGREQIESRKAS